jgi:heat shock protein HslJ
MPSVGAIAIYVRRAALFVTALFLASPLARADSTAGSGFSNELEGALWRIASVTFEQSPRRFHHDDIFPHGDNGSDAYISFNNGEINGSLECGRLSGKYNSSQDGIQISVTSNSKMQDCKLGSALKSKEVIIGLNGVVRIEREGDDNFRLFDEQKSYYIRLELQSPGFDFSEFRNTFWRLININGNPIVEPNAEVKIDEQAIDVSRGSRLLSFPFRYRSKKFSFYDPWKLVGCNGIDNTDQSNFPAEISFKRSLHSCRLDSFLAAFEQNLHRIASYAANGDELAILDQFGQQLMLLKRIHSQGLEYRYWHIAAYRTDWGVQPTTSGQFQVVTFVRGKVEGTAGCGALDGFYTLAGEGLTVKAGSSLAGLCFVQDENENGLVLLALNNASRVKEDGARILLQDDKGETNIVLMPYSRQPPRSADKHYGDPQ